MAQNTNKPLKPALRDTAVIDSSLTLRKLLKKLEQDFGWSFYDENGKLHITEMQKELIIDVARATRELMS